MKPRATGRRPKASESRPADELRQREAEEIDGERQLDRRHVGAERLHELRHGRRVERHGDRPERDQQRADRRGLARRHPGRGAHAASAGVLRKIAAHDLQRAPQRLDFGAESPAVARSRTPAKRGCASPAARPALVEHDTLGAAVARVGLARDQAPLFQPVEKIGQRHRLHMHALREPALAHAAAADT